jgi:group I intron endonuclease
MSYAIPGIYEIRNTRNGYRYVGCSKNVANRWQYHLYRLRKGTHQNPRMQAAWNKYGEGLFDFRMLEEVPIEKLLEAEQRWLDETDAAGRRDYYNFLPIAGSRRTAKATAETRRRMSLSMMGRTFSPEHLEKLRAAKLATRFVERSCRQGQKNGSGNFAS